MVIYALSFFLSAGLIIYSEHLKGIKRKVIVAIGLLIPILLAGMRKIGIGTDTEIYVNVLYEAASESHNFFEYLSSKVYSNYQMKLVSTWEIGYNLLVYTATKITHSFQGVLFFTHFVIIAFIYKGLQKLNGSFSRGWAMLLYYFMFYASSLNLMRQWIAISIIFYGFHFIQNNKLKNFLLCIFASALFHYSAVIGILLWPIYKFFSKFRTKKTISIGSKHLDSDITKVILFTIVCVFILLGISLIANVLASVNAIFARYVRIYISGNVELMPMQIIRRLPLALILIVNWKNLKRNINDTPFYYGMFVVDTAISQLGSITAQSGRLGYFFSVFEIVIISAVLNGKKRDWKLFYKVVLIVYVMFSFYYDNVLMGRAEIVPYLFFFN